MPSATSCSRSLSSSPIGRDAVSRWTTVPSGFKSWYWRSTSELGKRWLWMRAKARSKSGKRASRQVIPSCSRSCSSA